MPWRAVCHPQGPPVGCPGDLSPTTAPALPSQDTLPWQPKDSLSAQHQHCWDRQSKGQREGKLLTSLDIIPKWAEERCHHPAELKEAGR